MKALVIVTICFVSLVAYPKNPSFVLPEDAHSFIYFLQKKLSQKDQQFTIITPALELPNIVQKIIKNKSSVFNIYIHRYSKISAVIERLALYRHINILLCEGISKTHIKSSRLFITTSVALTLKSFQKRSDITVKEVQWTQIKNPIGCKGY